MRKHGARCHAHAEKANSAFFKWFCACVWHCCVMHMPLPGMKDAVMQGGGGGMVAKLREKIFARVVDSKKNRD
ncbi:MAG: hypothetical protein WA956_09090 [Stenotrophomonas sp.]